MDEIPDDIIQGAVELGKEVAEEVVASVREGILPVDPEEEGRRTVDRLTGKIDKQDPKLAREAPVRSLSPDLAMMFATYVTRFVSLLRSDGGALNQQIPLYKFDGADGAQNFGGEVGERLVPIDTRNARSKRAIMALAKARRVDGFNAPDLGLAYTYAEEWDDIAKSVDFVDMCPAPEASRTFFQLFTISYWMGRRSVARTGQSTVNFTVDCFSHGYQLEYWPQFLFTPTVFGATLTRPVSMAVPINYYHFQGWLNNAVTPDGGLYPANANNTLATLRAF